MNKEIKNWKKKGKNCGKLKRQERLKKKRSEILENKKVGDLESLEKSGKSGKTGKQTYFRNMIEKMREFENSEKNSEIQEKYGKNPEKIRSENWSQCLGLITEASKHELARILRETEKTEKNVTKQDWKSLS